jgi:Cu/Ag efflux protein CusF
MRKVFVLLSMLFFVISLFAFTADIATGADTSVSNKSAKNKKNIQQKKHFFGLVKFIDAEGGKITVLGKKSEKTFQSDSELLSNIKLDDKVFVKYTNKNNTLIATTIKPMNEKLHHSGIHMRGEVKSVDASKGTITVQGRKGETTFSADKQLLKEFTAGDKVYIKYSDAEGKLVANSIRPIKQIKASTEDKPKINDKK